MSLTYLTALPVYNEAIHVDQVLDLVLEHCPDVLVVDDGSSDGTAERLARRSDVQVATHATNRGYGAALLTAFEYAIAGDFDIVVTIDCDGQHEPERISSLVDALQLHNADILSGSRYLEIADDTSRPPEDRRRINVAVTERLNAELGLELTDAFCGFKAYRIAACQGLEFDVDGYEFPMQFWVQAVANNLRIHEIPVRLIYNNPSRSFGGPLDDAEHRLESYRATMHREFARCAEKLGSLRGS